MSSLRAPTCNKLKLISLPSPLECKLAIQMITPKVLGEAELLTLTKNWQPQKKTETNRFDSIQTRIRVRILLKCQHHKITWLSLSINIFVRKILRARHMEFIVNKRSKVYQTNIIQKYWANEIFGLMTRPQNVSQFIYFFGTKYAIRIKCSYSWVSPTVRDPVLMMQKYFIVKTTYFWILFGIYLIRFDIKKLIIY